MDDLDYRFIADLLMRESGLSIGDGKAYLIDSRLSPIARQHGLDGVAALIGKLRMRPSGPIVADVVDAMTTNESLFFRDNAPFDILRDHVLPKLTASQPAGRPIRIWSSACSTGQEPYSLAMTVAEATKTMTGHRAEVVATDISPTALARAKEGIYSRFEVMRGLPVKMLVKYFDQQGDTWKVKDDLKANIRFRPFNLLHDSTPLGQFDVVYCRNVLIYFDAETKCRVLTSIAKRLRPEGFLFLGSAEGIKSVENLFAPVPGHRGVYSRVADAAVATPNTVGPAAGRLKGVAA